MPSSDTAAQAVAQARRSLRGARLLLFDPRTDAAGALLQIAAGWTQLSHAVELGAGMRAADREGLEERVSRIASQAQQLLREPPAEPPSRREVRRELRMLARAVRAARREVVPAPRRWLGPVAALLVLGAFVGAVVVAAGIVREGVRGGWRGAYYPKPGFEGEPVVRRDGRIDFAWGKSAAVRGGPRNAFSVRWDGCLHVDRAGELELRLGSDDGSRVYVDGERTVDNWGPHGRQWKTGYAELEPGWHHLRVEYFEKNKKAAVALELREPGLPSELLPPERIRAPQGPLDAEDPCDTGTSTVPGG